MSKNQNPSSKGYSAENIQVLEGLEAVRLRPSMYIGDTGVRGLHHLIWEAVDNTIDEAMAGFCNKVVVEIHPDGGVEIRDNGRGIPTDIHPKEQKSALEVVMTVLHAGGKFDKNTYKVSGGLHGVGISCVNALSIYLKATVYRQGKEHVQTYEKGVPQGPMQIVGETHRRGTTIYFKPDPSIFSTTTYKYETIVTRLRELAFLNPGLELQVKDLREEAEGGGPLQETFFSEGGLREFVTFLDQTREALLPAPIYIEGEKNGVAIQVALNYNDTYSEHTISYVNNINTIEGGTHVTGFRRGLVRAFKKYATQNGLLERAKVTLSGEDFREGLTAVISVRVAEPQFEGQTKTKLGNSEAAGAVDTSVGEALFHYLEEHPKEARRIYDKADLAAQARKAAFKAREAVQQRKSGLIAGTLTGVLADCQRKKGGELFIVEGNSAGGTAKQGRDREWQAILPLRGKILNIEKAQEYKIYDNEQIKNMIIALGLTFTQTENGRVASLEQLRYEKIIIMTDADIDGSHIRTLILTFFFRYAPELIQQGMVYIALPPLYQVKRGKESIYCWTEAQREEAVQQLSQSGKINVQRYKGLGEMNPEQLWETTMDPQRRTFKRVNIESMAAAEQIFSILMGDDVEPRKAYIHQNAQYARLDI